jgi:hypothetical protein
MNVKQLALGYHKPQIRTKQHALKYCLEQCPKRNNPVLNLGCAIDCQIRKNFKLPPHGEFYTSER